MPAPVELRICIVGGGIAGLATAAILRGEGRKITVLEQSRMLKEVGAAISLQPNASGILERLGWGEDMRKAGAMVDNGFQIFGTDGSRKLQIASKRETNNGHDRVLFHRVDLHDMLKDLASRVDTKLGEPAEIRVASRVSSCDCEAGTIMLEDGQTLGPFDLIIGADGIHSKIRDSVLGKHVDAKPTGLSAYRLIIPKDHIEDLPHAYAQCTQETWTSMMVGQHCRAVMGPCRNGDLLSIVALVPDDQLHEASADSWTSAGSLEHLLESYANFPPWMKELFSRSPALGLWQLRDIDPLQTWVKGRVILIGDAAHAMLPTQGQGASQSIEDAEALKVFLEGLNGASTASEIEVALQRVFKVRHDRATLIQQYSRQQGKSGANEKGEVTLNPAEFHQYNVTYNGALEWEKSMAA
ncbi:FAD binding domain-containing protein [Meredithblackwellia eburnea MCA 4105]